MTADVLEVCVALAKYRCAQCAAGSGQVKFNERKKKWFHEPDHVPCRVGWVWTWLYNLLKKNR